MYWYWNNNNIEINSDDKEVSVLITNPQCKASLSSLWWWWGRRGVVHLRLCLGHHVGLLLICYWLLRVGSCLLRVASRLLRVGCCLLRRGIACNWLGGRRWGRWRRTIWGGCTLRGVCWGEWWSVIICGVLLLLAITVHGAITTASSLWSIAVTGHTTWAVAVWMSVILFTTTTSVFPPLAGRSVCLPTTAVGALVLVVTSVPARPSLLTNSESLASWGRQAHSMDHSASTLPKSLYYWYRIISWEGEMSMCAMGAWERQSTH